MPADEYLSITQAARAAKVHVETLRRWIKRGIVPLYGHRSAYRVKMSEVLPRATSPRAKVYYTPDDRAPVYHYPAPKSKTKAA